MIQLGVLHLCEDSHKQVLMSLHLADNCNRRMRERNDVLSPSKGIGMKRPYFPLNQIVRHTHLPQDARNHARGWR